VADENIDLRFLAEQGKQILAELAEARTERKEMRELLTGMGERLSGMDAALYKIQDSISELQVSVAAIRTDQGRTNELLEQVHETQQSHGARLNTIDGRLALIEKHAGMVKA
jgi:chromosome segregation ATPase